MTFAQLRRQLAEREAHFNRVEEAKRRFPRPDYFDDAKDFELGLLDHCPPDRNPDPNLAAPVSREAAAREGLFAHPEDWEMSLSDPYRAIILYYDPRRYGTEASRRKLLRDASRQHPGRQFRLRPLRAEEFAHMSISPFSGAETQFAERGHVSEIDQRGAGVGQQGGAVALVARNEGVTRSNAMLCRKMLKAKHGSLDLQIGRLDDWREEELDELMAHIVGKRARKDDPLIQSYAERPEIVETVLHQGLLLGSSAPVDKDVYLGTPSSPETTRKGDTEHVRKLLYGTRWKNVAKQLAFELQNAHVVFGADRVGNRKAEVDQANAALNGAVLTWFSQVVVAQRRVAWRSRVSRDWPIATQGLVNEKKVYGHIAGVEELSWRANDMKDPIGNLIDEARQRSGVKDVVLRMSLEDRILAAVHGSKVDIPPCGEYDYFNNGYQLLALANWIGSLKRTGEATMTQGIARSFEMSRDWINQDRQGNHLLGQFRPETWAEIFETARRLRPRVTVLPTEPGRLPRVRRERDPSPIKIRYEWVGADTIEDMGVVRRRGGGVTICGPMLCFPVNQEQRDHWIRKSAIIRELGGFQVPAQPRRR